MINPIDTRQVEAFVNYRRELVAADAERARQTIESPRNDVRSSQRVRVAVGIGVMRVGARIAGTYVQDQRRLLPGV